MMGDFGMDKEDLADLLDKLGEVCAKTGESPLQVLTEEVENAGRLASCGRHAFWKADAPSEGVGRELGRVHCANCCGWLRFPEATAYRAGYVAHGGNADELFADVSVN